MNITDANWLFNNGDYEGALRAYQEYILLYPHFAKALEANKRACERRIKNKNGSSNTNKACSKFAVFANYSAHNRVEGYVIYYLRKLREVLDYIVFVSDNELDGKEKKKLSGVVDWIISGRHGEYDFGSYKRGLAYLLNSALFQGAELLILCNDSCYGPVNGFDKVFADMSKKNIDYWGLTQNSQFQTHLQSYFLVFSYRVFKSSIFQDFFYSVKKEVSVQEVITKYEVTLTKRLENAGFVWASYISTSAADVAQSLKFNPNITVFPILMLEQGSPLLKVKAFHKPTTNYDGILKTLNLIRDVNGELYSCISDHRLSSNYLNANPVSFSVILPTFNRRDSLIEAVSSVIRSGCDNVEIIIIDDGSSDDTEEICKSTFFEFVSAGVIRYIKLPQNYGVAVARNVGLALAKNEWIAYLDSDNAISPYFFRLFENVIISNKDSLCFYSRAWNVNSQTTIGRAFDYQLLSGDNFIDIGTFVHKNSHSTAAICHDNALKRLVDWDFILRWTKENTPVFFPVTTLYYNDASQNDRISVSKSFGEALVHLRQKNFPRLKITTAILAYNHESFIREAIDSVVRQQGDFDHEIILFDDASTDSTWNIFCEFNKKHGKKIIGVKHDKNIGQAKVLKKAISWATGDFLAILEGDDIWDDKKKLLKQSEFLCKNSTCSMVFSKIQVKNQDSGITRLLNRQVKIKTSILEGADFLEEPSMNLIGTFSACMFFKHYLRLLPSAVFDHRVNEIAVAFHCEKYGPIGFIPDPMVVYRQHARGMWSGASHKNQLQMAIKARELVKNVARDRYRIQIEKKIGELRRELKKC